MESLSDDLFLKILSFLSLNEKIMMREISLYFKNQINTILLSIYKLEYLFNITHPVVIKEPSSLSCYLSYNNCTIYKMKVPSNRVHPLFSRNSNYDQCMVEICREKKLGDIYFSKRQVFATHQQIQYQWNYYNKRNIPYCSNCFYKWTLRCSNDEPEKKA